jgi:uncharacterized protein DUF2249
MNEIPGKHWLASDGLHIDVRGLQPPEPMVAILAQLEKPDVVEPVIVHHFCEPIYLYPELSERNWIYEIVPGEIDEVRLILTRRQ